MKTIEAPSPPDLDYYQVSKLGATKVNKLGDKNTD